MPETKNSSSSSRLRLSKGSTAMDWRETSAFAAGATASAAGDYTATAWLAASRGAR